MKYRLISKKTGKQSGIVDEDQKKITQHHPHTKGKYIYEPIDEPKKPVAVSKKEAKKQ
jgi:hypothetical protein